MISLAAAAGRSCRCTASSGCSPRTRQLAREAGVPADSIVMAENGSVVELDRAAAPRIVDQIDAGVTFVDGLGVGDVQDVALRDRRHLSEDGVLIIVATLAARTARRRAARADRARVLAEPEPLLEERASEAERRARRAARTQGVPRSSSSRSTSTTPSGS